MSELSIVGAISALASREPLSPALAEAAMGDLLAGRATPAQIGAFLLGLRVRGESAQEVAGLVRAMRAASVRIEPRRDGLIDLCGTGGDGSGTFNISTAAALVVAACGVPVAKHGNRSASSKCGSADVLETLGVPVELEPERVRASIEELGFGFLFARTYHPAMRHVAGPRRELGTRTVFNLLGPMTNPAGVRRQLVGVFADEARPLVAEVLRETGSESVWVVHGEGGIDELSIAGPSRVTVVTTEGLAERVVEPADAGLESSPLAAIQGDDAATNARIITAILDGEKGPHRDAVVWNAAGGLVAHGDVDDLRAAAEEAADAIDSGRAKRLLDDLRSFR